jgi:predicted nucleic acid-binding protein
MLFDSDVVIWAIRGSENAAKAIDSADVALISAATYLELVQDAKNKEDLKWIKAFLNDLQINIIPLSENIGHRACIYMETYGLRSGIGVADALIAATAAENNICLCTGNLKDFKLIEGINVEVFKA